MHVFVDTNIFLSFYHYSSDELDALNKVFADHEHGAATVYLTEQVQDEFDRNRDTKINDALKRFDNTNLKFEFPSFMKGFEEYETLRKLKNEAKEAKTSIRKKVDDLIKNRSLQADRLLAKVFAESKMLDVSSEVMLRAKTRMARGNPPGKNDSLGDAINWEILIENVPDSEDIHIVSADGDFYSKLNEHKPNAFLEKEWESKKKAVVYVYRTLSEFIKEHFDGIAFAYDKDKQNLIDRLNMTGNFNGTHYLIEKLEKYSYFSQREVEKILDAATDNDQFGWIVQDLDVSDFLNRHAVPQYSKLTRKEHREILEKVTEEQEKRSDA